MAKLYKNKATGLVPVKLGKNFRNCVAGEVAGFTPQDAQWLVTKGHAAAYEPKAAEKAAFEEL